jgi:GNAT superfamily N-acetyltransferase
MIQITETSDYRPLIPFFIKNELEFGEGDEYGDDEIVKCWRADEFAAATQSGKLRANVVSPHPAPTDAPAPCPRLVGGCILAKREGEFICDGIAVADEFRNSGLGKELLELLLGEAKRHGADKVFLVARAPGFFAKAGFVPVPREAAPEFFECFTCPQYGKTCHPEAMRLDMAKYNK